MRLDLEQAFIRKYVLKIKRERYLAFVASSKRRGSFLGMLYHGQDLDKSFFQQLQGSHQQQVDAIRSKAKLLTGGDNCYIVSVNQKWDGKEMPTADAIDKVVNSFTEGTLLIFGNCEGIYYEGEPPHNCYLSA